MINVSKIKKGIVIDHIEYGHGFQIFKQLKLDEIEDVVVILRNIPSKKMGKKDLIKIETDLDINFDILGLMDPNATVNIVENGEIKSKIKLNLPKKVYGTLKCKNPRCISHFEEVPTIEFTLVDCKTKEYKCEYCDSRTHL